MAEFDNLEQDVVCISHVDLDGYCAAAIVKKRYPHARVFYSNYGRDIPNAAFVRGCKMFVTDYSLLPHEMDKCRNLGIDLIWVDHHEANYRALEEQGYAFPGLRKAGISGSELTWMYLYPAVPPPRTVKLVTSYDLWKFDEPGTKEFADGIGLFEQRVSYRTCYVWNDLLSDNPEVVEKRLSIICDAGGRIAKFKEFRNMIMCRELSYVYEFMGKKVLVANTKQGNSMFFDSISPELRNSIDALCVIQYASDIKRYRASFYSPDNVKIVLPLAQVFPGGGGHPGACGFQTAEYPFALPPSETVPPMKDVITAYERILDARKDMFANQAACKSDKISLIANVFKTSFLGKRCLAINHPFMTELLTAFNHTVDIIDPIDGSIFHTFVGFVRTKTNWFRSGVWFIDRSNIPPMEQFEQDVKNAIPDAKDFYEENVGGFLGVVRWFYSQNAPVNIPLQAK